MLVFNNLDLILIDQKTKPLQITNNIKKKKQEEEEVRKKQRINRKAKSSWKNTKRAQIQTKQ